MQKQTTAHSPHLSNVSLFTYSFPQLTLIFFLYFFSCAKLKLCQRFLIFMSGFHLINELNSRHHKRKTIARIEIGDNKISSAADKAEAFNHHVAKIGHDLASEIPLVNTQPESFLVSANKTFSFSSCCTSEVLKLLEKLEGDWPGQFTIQVSQFSGQYFCTIPNIYVQSIDLHWYCSN